MFPHVDFIALMTTVQQQCVANAAYLRRQDAQRVWMLPPAAKWGGNPFNIADIRNAFDRAELGQQYVQVYQDANGKTGDVMGIATQINYTAMMERAFRLRHMTPVRALAHVASRRLAQAEPGGVHLGIVLEYVRQLFSTGEAP